MADRSVFDETVAQLQTEFRTLYDAMIAQGDMTPQAAFTQVMLILANVHRRLQALEAWSKGHSTRHQRAVGGRS